MGYIFAHPNDVFLAVCCVFAGKLYRSLAVPLRDERLDRIHMRGTAAGRADGEHARYHPETQCLRLRGETRGIDARLTRVAPRSSLHTR